MDFHTFLDELVKLGAVSYKEASEATERYETLSGDRARKKMAQKERSQDTSPNALLPAAVAAGGGVALSKSMPLVTGRTRLYHGTAADNVPGIMEHGLQPAGSMAKGVTEVLPRDIRQKAKDLAYLTDKKHESRYYAGQAEALQPLIQADASREAIGLKVMQHQRDPLTPIKAFNPLANKGIVKADVPLWRPDIAARLTPNPEARGSFEEFRRGQGLAGALMPEHEARLLHKSFADATVLRDGVGADMIRDSPHFKGVDLKEIAQYAKARPGRLAAGIGLGAAGLAGLGYGAHAAYRHYNPMQQELPKQAMSACFGELRKLGAVSDDEARGALGHLDTLEHSKPTIGQAGRYAGLGALTGAAMGGLSNAIKGVKTRPRDLIAGAVTGGIGMGVMPLLRTHLDRRAEMGTLKKYVKEHNPGQGAQS